MKKVVIAAVLAVGATAANADSVRQVLHHDAAGNVVSVLVISGPCPVGHHQACYFQHVVWSETDDQLRHELAHVAGMKHGEWAVNSFGIPCARITASGLATGYVVGTVICNTVRGEFVEAK